MHKPVFLAATSVLALTSGVAMAGSNPALAVQTTRLMPIHSQVNTLYTQNSDTFGYNAVGSDNFTSGAHGTTWNAAGADDFVVPKGKIWKISEVDVSGVYEGCPNGANCGPATSEVITFYANAGTLPGKIVGKPQTVHCNDNAGNFACTINPVSLKGGYTGKGKTYWVSVAANVDAGNVGEWFWNETQFHGNPAAWENPGGGVSRCTTWEAVGSCVYAGTGDFAFDLKGTRR